MSEQKGANITWHDHLVTRDERWNLMGHKGCILWFTGLSACGKSTIANAVDAKLNDTGVHSFVLDGDNIRFGLNKDAKLLKEKQGYEEPAAKRFGLGFSAEDRAENIRRIGEVAKLFTEAGVVTATAFISPYRADRDKVRAIMGEGGFIEISVNASLETCEARDPKGLYKKARAGELKGFTGIDDPYEAPERPELVLDSNTKGIDELSNEVIAFLKSNGFIS
jgi:adenylylsulfate kinase